LFSVFGCVFFFRGEASVAVDLMPNIPISCLPPSHVDPEVHGLKIVVNCPQPGSSWATNGPPPVGRWSMYSSDYVVMVVLW